MYRVRVTVRLGGAPRLSQLGVTNVICDPLEIGVPPPPIFVRASLRTGEANRPSPFLPSLTCSCLRG